MNRFAKDIKPPVKIGELLDVRIESVGDRGDGITKVNGFIIFVSNTAAGERVKIKITKIMRKIGFGEVVERLTPAPKKVEEKSNFGGDNSDEDVESFGDLIDEK